jgi:hypothetical protein
MRHVASKPVRWEQKKGGSRAAFLCQEITFNRGKNQAGI